MKIAVTGANGFVGSHLLRRLKKDHEVLALGRSYDVVKGFDIPRVNLIINLASLNSSKESIDSPRDYFEANEIGNFNMLETAREMQACYMYLTSVKAVERNPYGASKSAAERWVQTYAETYDMPVILNRVGNLYGPGGDHFFVNQFVQKALNEEQITVYGDGSDRRIILHIDDLIDLLVDQVNNFGEYADFDEYQVSGGYANSLTISELLNYLEAQNVKYVDALKGQQNQLVMDNNDVTMVRDWQPKIAWKDGVHDLMKHYENSD